MAAKRADMWGLPLITAAAFFMQSLDMTILNTALPAIARSLHHPPLDMEFTVIGYSLTIALLIPVSGWVADKFGTRNTFLGAIFLFSGSSLLCAMSFSLPMLVAARVLQGVGGALMMPVARLAVLRAYPRHELVGVLNFVSIPGLVGPVVGPILGGWLVTFATWHWIFLINVPIGVAGFFYARRVMPDFTAPCGSFDLKGFAMCGLGLVLLTCGLDAGKGLGPWFVAPAAIVTGALLFVGYVQHARRVRMPLLRLGVFRTRTFAIGIAGNVAARLGMGCIPFLMPLMLQVGLGYPAIVAGMMMSPMAVGSLTAKTFVVRLLNRFGYRRTLTGISLLIGGLTAQFALMGRHVPVWLLACPLFVLGMVMSIQFTSMNTITLGDLESGEASTGNSFLSVTQQLSINFGVAISSTILRLMGDFFPGDVLARFHYTFVIVGCITMLASLVFMLLRPDDGDNLLPHRKKRTA